MLCGFSFNGSSAAIAAVHQYGLSTNPSKNKDFKVQLHQNQLQAQVSQQTE